MNTRNCIQCGKSVPDKNKNTGKILSCPYCGDRPAQLSGENASQPAVPVPETTAPTPEPADSLVSLESIAAENPMSLPRQPLPLTGDMKRFTSFLHVGLKGIFPFGKTEIKGRVCYRNGGNWPWIEWALETENGDFYWLEEEYDTDSARFLFKLVQEYTPTEPFDPKRAKAYEVFEGAALPIKEKDQAIIAAFEGLLPWEPKLGDRSGYLNAQGPKGAVYSAEWNRDEINFYRGKSVSAQEIYRAFDLYNDKKSDLYKVRIYRQIASICCGFFVLFLMLYMLFTGLRPASVRPPNDAMATMVNTGAITYASEIKSGPYKLDRMNRLYLLDVRMKNLLKDEFFNYEIDISDEKGSVVASYRTTFYHGDVYIMPYPDDRFDEFRQLFKISRKGDYYIHAALKTTPDRDLPPPEIRLYKNVYQPAVLLSMSMICLGITVLSLMASGTVRPRR